MEWTMTDEKAWAPHVSHEAVIEQAIGMMYGYPEWYELPHEQRDRVWEALRWLVDKTHGIDAAPPFEHKGVTPKGLGCQLR
jgi:hypothetical protein